MINVSLSSAIDQLGQPVSPVVKLKRSGEPQPPTLYLTFYYEYQVFYIPLRWRNGVSSIKLVLQQVYLLHIRTRQLGA